MKHGKAPTVEQKKILTGAGLNHWEWLIIQNLENSMIVRHRVTGDCKVIEKGGNR